MAKEKATTASKAAPQTASKREKIGTFQGHVVLSDGGTLETQWRKRSDVAGGAYALHYADGTVEKYPNLHGAQAVQKRNAYMSDRPVSDLHASESSTYACAHGEGCDNHPFGIVAHGSYTAYATKDATGKITSITLEAS